MLIAEYPEPWNSVSRPIPWLLSYQQAIITGSGNSGGKLIIIASFYTIYRAPQAGDKIYINAGNYKGEHTIKSAAFPWSLVLETDFDGTLTGGPASVLFLYTPTFKVYKGHTVADAWPTELPYEQIATFKPQHNTDYQVEVDLQGYASSMFTTPVPPPDLSRADGIDFNLFNKLRFSMTYEQAAGAIPASTEIFSNPVNVLRSSIATSSLNADFLDTRRPLNSLANATLFLDGCIKTILTELTSTFVRHLCYEGPIPADGDFNNDFNNDFFLIN